MRLVFYGRSAFAILLGLPSTKSMRADERSVVRDCMPNASMVRYARTRCPQLPRPLHLLVPRWERTVDETVVLHKTQADLPAGSFLKIDNGLYAAAPELCLVQLARDATDQELIMCGSMLCGSFTIDRTSPTGLRERTPLTTTGSIARFIERCPGINGIGRLRRCLPHITECAASPPEVFLRMVLALPHRLGGFGLTGAQINERVDLGKRARNLAARSYLIPDLCWPEHRLAVEYGADSVHLTSRQAMLDATKRLALEAEGFKVVSVTSLQLGNRQQMANVAREVGRHIGKPLRIRSSRFPASHRVLCNLDWSLQTFFAPDGRALTDGPSAPAHDPTNGAFGA